MKTLKRIGVTLAIVAGILLLLMGGLIALIGSPAMQTRVIGMGTQYLEREYGVSIGIGYMNLTMDGGLLIERVYLPDENGDTLAYIHSVKAKVNPATVYSGGKVRIGTVRVDSAKVYMWADSASGRFCFDYLAERFGGEEDTTSKKEESAFDLSIGSVELRRGRVRFDNRGTEAKRDGTIDFNHINADGIEIEGELGSIDTRRMTAEIKRLGARLTDEDGRELFLLKNLGIKGFACDTTDGGTIRAEEISAQTRNSTLTIADIYLESKDGLDGISEAIERGRYGAKVYAYDLTPSDLKAFAPSLGGFTRRMRIEIEAKGRLPEIGVRKIRANDGKEFILDAAASVSNYERIEDAKIDLRIEDLMASKKWAIYITKAAGMEDTLPQIANDLLPLSAKIEAKGKAKDMGIMAKLGCALGTVRIDGEAGLDLKDTAARASANISTEGINLRPIAGDAGLDTIAFSLNCEARMQGEDMAASAYGRINKLQLNGRTYTHIRIDTAAYDGATQTAEARLRTREDYGRMLILAKAEMGRDIPRYTAKAKITDFTPERMGIVDSTWRDKSASLRLNCELNFKDITKIDGFIHIDSVGLRNGEQRYYIGNIETTFGGEGERRKIETRSDLADVTFDGRYETESLVASVSNILHRYIPTFFDFRQRDYEADSTMAHNSFRIVAKTKDLSPVFGFMGMPIKIAEGASASVRMDDSLMRLGASVYVPKMRYDRIDIDGVKLTLREKDGMYVANAQAKVSTEGIDTISIEANTEMENDVFLTKLAYDNGEAEFPLMGELSALVSFPRDTASGELMMRTNILPGDILIDSLLLGMEPSVIDIRQSGEVRIDSFGLVEDVRRILNVHGIVGAGESDTLTVSLDSMSISNMISKLNLGVPITGIVSGKVEMKSLLNEEKQRYSTKDFRIAGLTYDGTLIGDVRLRNGWSAERRGMGVFCDIMREGKHLCEARGYLKPKDDELGFKCKLDEMPIDMAGTALSEFVSNIGGSVSADFTINGKISEPQMNGHIYIRNATAKAKNTGCTYTINDSILFTPTQMKIKDLMIKDEKGNTATLNCEVEHHNFEDFKYKGKLALDNFQVLNNPKAKNETAYGDFGVNGILAIKGDESGALFGGKLTASDNSTITIVLPESETKASKYSNIVFVSKDTTQTDTALAHKMQEKAFKLETNISVELKEDMKTSVVIDKQTGDYCEVRGTGNIRAEYSSQKNDMALYGTYTISQGQLKMKISKLPMRPFVIESGSNINVGGPLSSLNFDLKASYTTKTDLTTLDESFVDDPTLTQTRVSAAAVLSVKGNMDKFDLGYDVTLPGASEELKQRVSGIVNTDELRIKEFAYLIALNSFYTISGNSAAVGSTMISNVAGQSISNGLNTLLGDVLGSSWTVGADLTSTESDMSDMEMSFTLSRGFFNDRLMFSTDVGYQNQTQSGGSSAEFTNSFDLEYKLTKNGMFRLKGYRHANDEFYRQGTHTEGVGIVITKEAETLKGLFQLKQK